VHRLPWSLIPATGMERTTRWSAVLSSLADKHSLCRCWNHAAKATYTGPPTQLAHLPMKPPVKHAICLRAGRMVDDPTRSQARLSKWNPWR